MRTARFEAGPLVRFCTDERRRDSYAVVDRNAATTERAARTREDIMSVARVTEITSASSKSFDDAIREGLARANKTLENVTGAWIKDQEVVAKNGKITEYRVRMKISFVLKD
jgi:flavin-binding protein dodecin